MDFNKIKIIKKLGSGMLGTVYMIDYDGKIYSQKIQHILENQKEQNLKYSIWREKEKNLWNLFSKKYIKMNHIFIL
jgi:hypothetical protein